VTAPTTIMAITDRPAKTPSPIGRTDIDFPGRPVLMAPAGVPDAAASVPVGAGVGEVLVVSVDEVLVVVGNPIRRGEAGTELVPRFNTPPLVAVPGVVVFGVGDVKSGGVGVVLVGVSVLGVDVFGVDVGKAGGVENFGGVLVGVSVPDVDVVVTVLPVGVVSVPPPPLPPPALVSGI